MLLSLAPLPWLAGAADGVAGRVKSELSLLQQEADYYRRRSPLLGGAGGGQKSAASSGGEPGARIDPSLAAFLVTLPAAAAGRCALEPPGASGGGSGGGSQAGRDWFDRPRFDRDYQILVKRELPYARAAGICGACGDAVSGASSSSGGGTQQQQQRQQGVEYGASPLADSDYAFFLAYCAWKAAAAQLPPGPRRAAGSSGGGGVTGMEMLHSGAPAGGATGGGWAEWDRGGALDAGFDGASAVTADAAAATAAAAAEPPPPAAAAVERWRRSAGEALLGYARLDAAAEAARGGGGGGSGGEATSGSGIGSGGVDAAAIAASLSAGSASLDSIRGAVRALLAYLQWRGARAAPPLSRSSPRILPWRRLLRTRRPAILPSTSRSPTQTNHTHTPNQQTNHRTTGYCSWAGIAFFGASKLEPRVRCCCCRRRRPLPLPRPRDCPPKTLHPPMPFTTNTLPLQYNVCQHLIDTKTEPGGLGQRRAGVPQAVARRAGGGAPRRRARGRGGLCAGGRGGGGRGAAGTVRRRGARLQA